MIIDGKAISLKRKDELKKKIDLLKMLSKKMAGPR